jgi:hypothetical protein
MRSSARTQSSSGGRGGGAGRIVRVNLSSRAILRSCVFAISFGSPGTWPRAKLQPLQRMLLTRLATASAATKFFGLADVVQNFRWKNSSTVKTQEVRGFLRCRLPEIIFAFPSNPDRALAILHHRRHGGGVICGFCMAVCGSLLYAAAARRDLLPLELDRFSPRLADAPQAKGLGGWRPRMRIAYADSRKCWRYRGGWRSFGRVPRSCAFWPDGCIEMGRNRHFCENLV